MQINYYAMQNLATNFPEPGRFMPERWLGSLRGRSASPETSLPDANGVVDPLARTFLPYSAGPRSCIGQPLAQMEVRMPTSFTYLDESDPLYQPLVLRRHQSSIFQKDDHLEQGTCGKSSWMP